MSDIQLASEALLQKILLLRGHKVMLSHDLAVLYGVLPRVLMQAVKRNLKRFPPDFMFQLTKQEWDSFKSVTAASKSAVFLRSQIVTLDQRGKHAKFPPHAFTEQGVAMLSSVLKSDRAVEVNIAIMRAFVRLREVLSSHRELSTRLDKLESKLNRHDREIIALFDAIRELVEPPPEAEKPPIGFDTEDKYRKKLPT